MSAPTPCWCRTPPRSWRRSAGLVQTLDVPVRQVLIEARIVIVSDTFERDLGAQFGVTTAQTNGNNGLLAVTGNGTGTDTMVQSALGNLGSRHRGSPRSRPRPSPIGTWSIYPRRRPTAASVSRSWAGAISSISRSRRRRTKARAKRFRRRVSSPRTRSKPPSCKVSRSPIRNRPRAAPRPRNSRTPCCRSR